MTEGVHTGGEGGHDRSSDSSAEDESPTGRPRHPCSFSSLDFFFFFLFLMRTQFPTANSSQDPIEQRKTACRAAHYGIFKRSRSSTFPILK